MFENPKKFPILRLPTVASEQVIRSMELRDMFILSLISTKAKALLNYSLPKNHAHIKCSFLGRKNFDILFFYGSDSVDVRLYYEQEQDHLARAGSYNSHKCHNILCKVLLINGPMVFISDRTLEVVAKAFLKHLAESFHTPKISMEFGDEITPGAALMLLNHAKSLNLPMERLALEAKKTPAEVYTAFLNEGPIAKQLVIVSEATPDFQYSPSEIFKLDRFHVFDGHWIHLQDFMECRSIVVYNKTSNCNMYCMNVQRLNEFFKVWLKSSWRLEYLQISVSHSQRLNFEEVTMGLNGTNFNRYVSKCGYRTGGWNEG